ncbi:MAG: tetraacyldisaccharide 4'-kinase, partial [Flavisolibacter sp.]|nr:tetraacyldisaccharide 4'-kinase [Flavisolibacter sp.]
DYGNLFTRDFYLPTGDLRDLRSSIKRADVIIVTKCPGELSENERTELVKEIAPLAHQQLYCSTIAYGIPYHITLGNEKELDESTEVLLITGIANPRPLKMLLENQIHTYYMMHYNDHHIFTIDDWNEIRKKFNSIENRKKILLTTEKDAMRLMKFGEQMNGMPFYVIPIEHRFLFEQAEEFLSSVGNFIKNFKQPS